MKKTFFVLFTLALLLPSCNRNEVYRHFIEIPQFMWLRENKIVFHANIEQPIQSAILKLHVRHATEWPYPELRIKVISTQPSKKQETHTYTIPFKDAKGKLLSSGMGDTWDRVYTLEENAYLGETGTYEYEIEHAMNDEAVMLLMEVGLSIEKSAKD